MELPAAPSFRLDGKRALITGAGRGIGLACAAALAQAGAEVTLAARSEVEISAAATAITSAGGKANILPLDVSDIEQVKAALSQVDAFDILVNNVGINRPKPFLDVTPDDYDAVLDLNLRAAFFVAQAVTAAMIKAGKAGSLIHMGSQMGHVGGINRSIYCASKWGLEGLSKAISLDTATFGIRSNTIAPTFIETAMTKPFFEDVAFKTAILSKIKLGRLGRVEDLMGAVIYLASDASALVTGTSLLVDGGWTAD